MNRQYQSLFSFEFFEVYVVESAAIPAETSMAPGESAPGVVPYPTHVLPRSIVRELSRRSSGRGLFYFLFDLSLIAATALVLELYWHPFLYILSLPWIGSRFQCLGAYVHDAVHETLVRGSLANRILGEIGSFLLVIDFESQRKNHLLHHRYVQSAGDPDLEFLNKITRRGAAIRTFLIPFTGLFVLIAIYSFLTSPFQLLQQKRLRAYLLSAGVIAVIALSIGFPVLAKGFLLYWLIPVQVWFSFSFMLRTLGEHGFIETSGRYNHSRTIKGSSFDTTFLVPRNVNFHMAHHTYPSVPFFNLKKLDEKMRDFPEFRDNSLLEPSFRVFLKKHARHLLGLRK